MLKKAENLVGVSVKGVEDSDFAIEVSEVDGISIFGGQFDDLNFF